LRGRDKSEDLPELFLLVINILNLNFRELKL
jgi:hypothetical protein